MEYVLTIWLTATEPEVTMPVTNCGIGARWYEQALLWAARSGLPLDEPGYLCSLQTERPRTWRVNR